jgi:hypothetical protein
MYTDPHTLRRLTAIHHQELIDAAQRSHAAKAARAASGAQSGRRWMRPSSWAHPLAGRQPGQSVEVTA